MPHNTLTVGSVEITVLHDAEVASPFSQSFPDVPAKAWAVSYTHLTLPTNREV